MDRQAHLEAEDLRGVTVVAKAPVGAAGDATSRPAHQVFMPWPVNVRDPRTTQTTSALKTRLPMKMPIWAPKR